MSQLAEFLAWLFMLTGVVFFTTGALGLIRFPDLYSRLHAVTKTDTLGLGLLTLGLAIKSGSYGASILLLFIWLIVLASSAVNCQLLARYNLEAEANTSGSSAQTPERDNNDP